MPRPRNTPTVTPSTLDTNTVGNTSAAFSQLTAVLPNELAVQYPNVAEMMPSDWFRPSSSNVPRTDNATFRAELQIAKEQNNSIKLLSANIDNAIELAGVAVKTTKVAKLVAEYLIGLEEIKAVGVRLRAAQSSTANEERKVLIIEEKGRQLDNKLIGERIKTGIEAQKNSITQLESNYYSDLHPIKQTEWQNKLEAAKSKAQQALQGSRTALNS
jgi:hypothetical protein